MDTQTDIYTKVVSILEELFEIEADQVAMDSHLYQDLDIDSIDAVDLVVELKKFTGKKIKPEDFKSVRTVKDVVAEVEKLLSDD